MVAGEDERRREVRLGLLALRPLARRATRTLLARLLLLAGALLLAPAGAHAATQHTGRLLVTLDRPAGARAAAALDLEGVRRDGAQVPQLGVVSVKPVGGRALAAVARALRKRPGVAHVELERRYELRFVPNDPSLSVFETASGTPPSTPLQWWVPRTGLPAAWDIERGDGATVAVIDTGLDGGHPDLVGKVANAIDNDETPGTGAATGDENGHGTHVASMACGAGDNGAGIVGAGLNCRLIVVKSDLSDGSIARSIVQAADLGAGAINMSFGNDGSAPATRVISDAIDYAVGKDVVLVAAAADRPVEEQGDPANLLQRSGSGSDITAGRGLTVTAANFADQRAPFAGRGSQISLAAYGAFDQVIGPDGLIAAFPGNVTQIETGGGGLFPEAACECRTQIAGDNRFAYLQGTSMAAPVVAAIAALARTLNPDVRAPDVIRVLKETASRPPGSGWNPELGWGIVNGASALNVVASIDRRPPASKLRGPARVRGPRTSTLRWTGRDAARPKLRASGVAYYDVYRSTNRGRYKRIKRTERDVAARADAVRLALPLLHDRGRQGRQPRGRPRQARPLDAGFLGLRSQLDELGERVLDRPREVVEVVHRVVVAEQAEVHVAVVGHDRDRERVVLRQKRDREDRVHLAARDVERELRAGDVRHEHVEQARGEVDPRGLREHRRRGEVLDVREHLGADRLLGLLEVVHRGAHDAQALDGIRGPHRQRPAHRREPVAACRDRPARGPRPARARAAPTPPCGPRATAAMCAARPRRPPARRR